MKRLPPTTTTTTPSSSSSSSTLRARWPTTMMMMTPTRARHQIHQQQRPTVTTSALPERASVTSPSSLAAAAAAALAVLVAPASPALAAEVPTTQTQTPNQTTTTVYFGNGCFWGRQKDFVETELKTLSRPPERVSAVSGYAGGTGVGPDNKVCYHFNDPRQVYERLGHAEVVAVELDGSSVDDSSLKEMRQFSKTYFSQFRRLRDGRLQRLDPQDAGPGYRNVVGIPGGINSPLFEVLKSEAPAGVQLREGQGRAAEIGEQTASIAAADEGDEIGVIWVVDSSKLPFYRAEQYHQYHRGLEGKFPASYLKGQRDVALRAGRIDPTGCLEFPF